MERHCIYSVTSGKRLRWISSKNRNHFDKCLKWMWSRCWFPGSLVALRWRHKEHQGVLNHQPLDCLLNIMVELTSKEISKVRVTDPLWGDSAGDRWIPVAKGVLLALCEGNLPMTRGIPSQKTRKMLPFHDGIMCKPERIYSCVVTS